MAEEKPARLHPKVVCKMYGVHLRTVFRWIQKGYLPSTEGRINQDVVEETLKIWKNSISKREARKILGIRANTLKNWKENGIIESVTVMGEERMVTDSIKKAPKKKILGNPIKRRGHKSICYMAEFLGSSPKHIRKYLGTDILSENVDGVEMVPLKEVERVAQLINESRSIRHSASYLGKRRSYVEKMISNGELKSFKFLGKTRVTKSSLLALMKKTGNPIWLRDKKLAG